MFGLVKIKLLLAFTLAAFNLETIRSFLSKMAVVAEVAKKPRTRKKASPEDLGASSWRSAPRPARTRRQTDPLCRTIQRLIKGVIGMLR